MIGAGTVLDDRYEVVSLLATGGMSEVFLGRDRRLGRQVAIKVWRGVDPTERARFESEGRVLARLDHPNLVRLYDVGQHDDVAYLVLEYVEGRTVAELIRAGPLEAGQTADIGGDVAGALAYIHGAGVIHRDVKPSNILVEPDGRARLADFGIARLIDDVGMTKVGTTIGTAGYMSPEQVRGETATIATDVYSLGLVLLECLTGQAAFGGEGVGPALARLTNDPVIPSSVPPWWRDVVQAMTAAVPGDRPSISDVRARLQAGSTVGAPTVRQASRPTPTSVMDVGKRAGGRRGLALAAVAAAAVILLLVFLSMARGGTGNPTTTTRVTTPATTTPATTTPATTPPTTTRPVPTTATPTPAASAICASLEAQLQALSEVLVPKGPQAEQARKAIAAQIKALQDQLEICG